MRKSVKSTGHKRSLLGVVAILVLTGGVGLLLFHSKKVGGVVLVVLIACLGVLQVTTWSSLVPGTAVSHDTPHTARVMDIGLFFVKVGALTFGRIFPPLQSARSQLSSCIH